MSLVLILEIYIKKRVLIRQTTIHALILKLEITGVYEISYGNAILNQNARMTMYLSNNKEQSKYYDQIC